MRGGGQEKSSCAGVCSVGGECIWKIRTGGKREGGGGGIICLISFCRAAICYNYQLIGRLRVNAILTSESILAVPQKFDHPSSLLLGSLFATGSKSAIA